MTTVCLTSLGAATPTSIKPLSEWLVLYLHYARYRLRKAPSQAAAAAQLEVADEQMYPAIWKRGGLQ